MSVVFNLKHICDRCKREFRDYGDDRPFPIHYESHDADGNELNGTVELCYDCAGAFHYFIEHNHKLENEEKLIDQWKVHV